MKFRAGDIITGTELADSHYSYTTSKAVMRVIGVIKFCIYIEIISHETYPHCIGKTHSVNPKYFTLVSSASKFNYIEIEE